MVIGQPHESVSHCALKQLSSDDNNQWINHVAPVLKSPWSRPVANAHKPVFLVRRD